MSAIDRVSNKAISGTREWSTHSVNCCLGCCHDCRYCYAKSMADRFGRCPKDQWSREVVASDYASRGKRLYDGTVMFPTTHDITPTNLNACMVVLENLLSRGNQVLVVSKPHLECITAICGAFAKFKHRLLLRFSIGAYSNELLKFWEPGAPDFDERLSCLKLAQANGYQTSVSCEPLLQPGDVVELVKRLQGYVTETIWIGKINSLCIRSGLPVGHPMVAAILQWQGDESVMAIYESLKDNAIIRWKESYRKVVDRSLVSRCQAKF